MNKLFPHWFVFLLLGVCAWAAEVDEQKTDAEALYAKISKVLPAGWEAQEWKESKQELSWVPEEWRDFIPGTDGRLIAVRRKERVEVMEAFAGGPGGTKMRKESLTIGFALTLGKRQTAEETQKRLAALEAELRKLEVTLKPSYRELKKDGSNQYSVPGDDDGRRALSAYDKLWSIKRAFPQWTEGSLSIGFRPLVWVRRIPDEQKREYFQVKEAVLAVLKSDAGWKVIPADED
jgi:hypothetical protein